MSKPDINREITDLRCKLRLPESRTAAIETITRAYAKTGDMGAAAQELGVSKSTLDRCKATYPELARAIDRIREARAAVKG